MLLHSVRIGRRLSIVWKTTALPTGFEASHSGRRQSRGTLSSGGSQNMSRIWTRTKSASGKSSGWISFAVGLQNRFPS